MVAVIAIPILECLAYTLDDKYTDSNWGDVDWGVYRWAVEAVYTNNVSERAYSNCLDKDMETVVGVEVTTNSGDAPEGCMVLFTNTSEPDLALTYELELDASGLGSVDPFRKGVYDIMVTLPGFGDIMETDVLVDSDTTFVWQLEELLMPPSDLYVTPTGFATWSGGGAIPFEPYMTNFDDGVPEGWEIIVGGSSSDTWQWVTSDAGNTLDGTPFMFIDSDGAGPGVFMDEYLVSPVIDASSASELWVEFDQYYNTGWDAAAFGEVEVYDGNDWVTVLNQTSDIGNYGAPDLAMIDVTEYANADFRVRFHYSATWDWWWAVDNVMVHDNSGKYADGKAFQFFKIWHDGVLSNDVDTNFYQYGTNPAVDILVPGETYNACVASLYSTGLSAQTCYEWTYLPCDSFPSWTIFDAYNVEGSDDNLVVWTDNVFFTPIEEDFEAGLPEGWMTSTSSAVGWFFTTDGSSAFWAIPPGDGTYACSNDDAADDDGSVDYLITPEMTFVGLSDVQLTFSSFLDGAYGQTGTIEVTMDGGATWEVVESVGTAAAWTEVQVDLSAYVGTESIWVAFHSNDNGAWASGWAVDNVSIAPSKAGKADSEVLGANVYRDGEMIAFVPVPDTFLLDMNLEPGYYDYCVTKVYSADEGLHTWTSCEGSTCVIDVLVPEDCYAPENLTAEDLLDDGYTATLNWDMGGAASQEFRYDDGTALGQLGFTGGTTSSVMGNKHDIGAELTEMSWYLTAEGGPHANVTIYVMGLDGSGMPDGNNVLFSQSVSSTDETWNTFTFDSPINAPDGFFLGIGYNGFVGLGTDDGTGDPYNFVNGTHFYVSDYTAGGWGLWESVGFAFNGMIRAMGAPTGVASYPVIETEAIESNLTMVANETAIATGEPKWSTAATKEFMHFNVYRDGELIADDVTEMTYADEVGVAGEFCYEVTAVYSICGESAPSNEACVFVAVGVNDVENNISVYPNPANDFVMVEASQDIRSIEITNYMGQVVNSVKAVEMTQYRINTSSLSAGIYFVEVETTAGIEKVRIVISK